MDRLCRSRVSEDVITGSRPGTLFVHRNVADIVAFNDVNVAWIIEYGVVRLKIEDIIICGHTRCGGIATIEDVVHEIYIADWLCIASGAKEMADRIARGETLDPRSEARNPDRRECETSNQAFAQSRDDKEHARKGPLPRIHGWLYRVETVNVDVLVDGHEGHVG